MRLDDFHRVVVRNDPASGLRAVFAIHDLTLGPALGGVRRWAYPDDNAAIADVVRLARGMTFKNALANLPFGGGKSVIIAPGASGAPADRVTKEQLAQFGRWLDELGGEYVVAEDVGMGVADLGCIGAETDYVTGVGRGGRGGNPGPRTVQGVFIGMQVVAERLGLAGLGSARVAVQGLGNVGMALCERLHRAGAELVVADINPAKVALAQTRFAANALPVDALLAASVDIIAPCALGGAITPQLAATMAAHAIAGSANNQLAHAAVGRLLKSRGILYAPDYVINAGGVISGGLEYLGRDGFDAEVEQIGPRLMGIFNEAQASDSTEADVADAMAPAILRRTALDEVA